LTPPFWILCIQHPLLWIVLDVAPQCIQLTIVPDDNVVIPVLPEMSLRNSISRIDLAAVLSHRK
jgi:hypothetical protein